MDANKVPGMFVSNRPMKPVPKVSLCDMTATVLDAFDVPVPSEMDGKSIMKKTKNG